MILILRNLCFGLVKLSHFPDKLFRKTISYFDFALNGPPFMLDTFCLEDIEIRNYCNG